MTSEKLPDKSEAAILPRELASRILARRRLLEFIKRLDPTYMAGWVHRDICARLEKFSEDVAKGLSPRLMLLMPPRHGKSRIASMAFPAWHLGRYPNHEFISASYNVALSMGFSRKCQAVMEDPRYPFEDIALDPNNKSAETWGITNKGVVAAGGFIAAGVGGGITGKGAHVLSIDDPIKNHEEADSLLVREGLWDWYTSTAYTRLAPGGGVLVIQTCWHDDDLAGRLQQAMIAGKDDPDVDQFEIIKYPAVAEADEWLDTTTNEIVRIETKRPILRDEMFNPERWALHRAAATTDANIELFRQMPDHPPMSLVRVKGEALHTERYDLLKLARIRKTLPIRFWSALYQQNPVPDDGSFFTRALFKRAHVPDRHACNVFMTWDFAIKEKQHNDYTVGGVAYQDSDDLVHDVDMVRFKSGDAFFIVEAIIALIKKHKTPGMRIGFEDGQIFASLEALIRKRMRDEKLFVPYELLTPVTDKKVRAAPLQGRMQQGRWSFNDKAEWFPVAQAEMLRFPNGVHDDIVDQKAWMARLIEKYEAPKPRVAKHMKSWKDKLPRERRGDSSMVA
jgi:predicted phage terminase large subunit-like protein